MPLTIKIHSKSRLRLKDEPTIQCLNRTQLGKNLLEFSSPTNPSLD